MTPAGLNTFRFGFERAADAVNGIIKPAFSIAKIAIPGFEETIHWVV